VSDIPSVDVRVLIAGVGNLLRADDGFGVEVARQLLACPPIVPGVAITVIETGIGGMHLVQELLSGYDALIIVDAIQRDAEPGTLFILQPERVHPHTWSVEVRRDFFADTHYAEPSHALALAEGIGALPEQVAIVGCQVASTDDLIHGMCPAVERAVSLAVTQMPGIISSIVTRASVVEA